MCNLFIQCLLSFGYKRITVCLEVLVESHETYWILKQFRPNLSAKFGIDICQFIFVVISFFSSSISSLISSDAKCPGTHIKQFYATYLVFV